MREKKTHLAPEILRLPQTPAVWYMLIRTIQPKHEQEKLHVLAVLDVDTGELVGSEIFARPPKTTWVTEILGDCMLNPLTSEQAARPVMIEFEQQEFFQQIAPILTEAGIGARFFERPELSETGLMQAMPGFENAQPAVSGLLDIEGNTPELVREFFTAAADFYRQAPWQKLDDTQPLALYMDPPGKEYYVILMGKAGVQFGFLFFQSWEELSAVYANVEKWLETLPEQGLRMLSFEPWDAVPPADREAAQRLGWPVAAEDAVPVPVIYTQNDILRPDAAALARIIASLRAISLFVDEHLGSGEGQSHQEQAEYTLSTVRGELTVRVRYPAGEDVDDALEADLQDLEIQEDGDIFSADDKEYRRWLHLPEDQDTHTALELSRQAWQSEDPAERAALAKQALAHFDGCIRACIVLAEEAESAEEALEYFKRAMLSGEKMLDAELVQEYRGRLWDAPPARPYLVARQGFVECLMELEDYQQALPHCAEILALNLADHQGIRYALLYNYIILGKDDQALDLLQRYAEEEYAGWPYSRALLAYRKHADSPEARAALKSALRRNPLVPDYLTGRKLINENIIQATDLDDDGEAQHYASDYFNIWWQTKGAIAWLKSQTG